MSRKSILIKLKIVYWPQTPSLFFWLKNNLVRLETYVSFFCHSIFDVVLNLRNNISSFLKAETSRAATEVPVRSESEERSPSIHVEDEERPNILLTDDGRTLEAPKEDLICPFCQKEYQVNNDDYKYVQEKLIKIS